MKVLFETNDDWDDSAKVLNFKSKINSKTKTPQNNKSQVENGSKTKVKPKIHEDVSRSATKHMLKQNKGNKCQDGINKNEVIDEEFDGECKFTPLLRKAKQNGESFKVEDTNLLEKTIRTTEAKHSESNKKKIRKRKNDLVDDEMVIKNKKTLDHPHIANGEKKQDNISNEIIDDCDFANKLRDNLLGGRFRFLNEQLYTVSGNEAKQIFEKDQDAFKAYHKGYRQQIEKWPFNPLDRIIKRVRKLPKHMTIADFGCGEAKLAESIRHKCFSIDLISSKPDVIACDMANTPLKTQSIDVAVFCLSLMGTNLQDFICEANRVLKKDGTVYVAEIGSRFENVKNFKKLWEHLGFELLRQDVDKKKYFYFFDFKKIENVKKTILSVVDCKLKPCIYKKR